MVREGKFPKPVQLAPNRVGWQVEVVTAWLADRSKGLVAHAVTHPEDLEPEQLEDQALDLALQALSKRTGKPVDPNGHYLQLAERVTLGEFYARQIHEFETMSECFGDIGLERAMYLAGWLFALWRDNLGETGGGNLNGMRRPVARSRSSRFVQQASRF